ncbi:hypothetical protein [Arthrobacter sp. 35W]|uniref:hypothetical protein n=1 Tax=Arthrobacter sp. 35W TaxID=1132441 RepID=UPI0004110EF0|nr:hypothetical protein [Arthrobacter sp. 35W]
MADPADIPGNEAVAAVFPVDAAGTGDAGVDAVLAGASALAGTPVAGHTALYAGLQQALAAELDADPAARIAES